MKVASVLESVTVYRQGAVCVRTAALVPGSIDAPRIRVGGLPLSAHAGSLRARIVGDGGVHVLDVRAGFDVELGEETDLAAELRALEAAQQQAGKLALAIDRIERELAELRGLLPQFREPRRREGPREAPIDAMLALDELVAERTSTLQAQRRALAIELEDAKERERTCAARLREAGTAARTARAQVSRAAIVTLTAVPQRDCSIAIEYEVPGARWVPTYQLALAEGGAGRLAMRASIAQKNGEDWSGVRLALSTASMRRRTAVPELRSIRVGRAQAEPQRAGWRETPPGLEGLFADYDAAAVPREVTARSMARPAAPTPRSAPPPPAAPSSPMMFGGGAPMPQAGAAMPPPSMAAPMQARMSAPMPASAPARARAESAKPMAYSADDEAIDSLEMQEHGAASTGVEFLRLPPEPAGPSAALLDYEALEIRGPDQASRGRLAPASPQSLAFATSVHVQVDVVMSAVVTAEHAAAAIALLPPPRDCVAAMALDRFDYRFDAIAPADVPSTGAWTNVAVMECDVELAPRYLCVPAVDPAVYRTLEITNRSSHALLPGPLDVSNRGQFLLTTTLGAVGPGVRGRRIGLGVEESIKVARNTRFAETSGGLFGGSTVLPHEVDIEIDNRLGVEIALEVRERVPIADTNEKDLKVEEHDAEPPWTAVDQPEDGVLVHGLRRWRVSVPARGKARLLAKYTIRMPADRMLVGGNRRS